MTVRINLLPWREWARERRKRTFYAALGLAAAAMGIVVALAVASLNASIGQQQERNRFLTSKIGDLDERIAEVEKLLVRRDRVVERWRTLEELLSGGSNNRHIFDELARTAVPGAYYTSVTRRGRLITAQGVAESNDRVAAMMRNLQDSDAFDAPLLKSIDKAAPDALDTQEVTFELTFATDDRGA